MTHVTQGLRTARERLGLDQTAGSDPTTLKRAYRKAVMRHPPDRDPEGFQSVRAAYELLCAPMAPVSAALLRESPAVPIPQLASHGARATPVRGATAAALLRHVVALLPTQDVMARPPGTSKTR